MVSNRKPFAATGSNVYESQSVVFVLDSIMCVHIWYAWVSLYMSLLSTSHSNCLASHEKVMAVLVFLQVAPFSSSAPWPGCLKGYLSQSTLKGEMPSNCAHHLHNKGPGSLRLMPLYIPLMGCVLLWGQGVHEETLRV